MPSILIQFSDSRTYQNGPNVGVSLVGDHLLFFEDLIVLRNFHQEISTY